MFIPTIIIALQLVRIYGLPLNFWSFYLTVGVALDYQSVYYTGAVY